MADAQHLGADQRPQLQFDLRWRRPACLRSRPADAPDCSALAAAPAHRDCSRRPGAAPSGSASAISSASRAPSSSMSRTRRRRRRSTSPDEIARHLAEMQRGVPSASSGVDRQHVVAHGAVAQRTAAAGIVAGHAADGGARGGRDVDREPQPVRLRAARFSSSSTMPGSTTQRRFSTSSSRHAVQMFRAVEDQGVVDGLAALRGAAAARRDRDALLAGDRQRRRDVVHRARHHHADRHDLVERGIGGVAAAGKAVEQHVALECSLQPVFERRAERRQTGQAISFAARPPLRRCFPTPWSLD